MEDDRAPVSFPVSPPQSVSMVAQGRIYLRALGDATLQRIDENGRAATLLDSSKLLALLAYLNAAPGRSATRDHLVHLLWSDLDDEAGRHALRHHLWLLKNRLADVIPIDRGTTLTLRDPIPSDRSELLEAAAEGDLLRVVSIYRGDFFPEFAGVGAQEFELWVERERTSLRSVFVRSGHIVVRQWLDLGRTRDAAALARRVREADRFDQGGWRLLLEALIAGQDRVSAAVEADAFERFADDEDLELEPASQAVVAAVKHPSAAQPNHEERETLLLSRELVGREAEFAMLVRAWDDASRGRFQGVHLTAPAGMGKTRLLHEYAARLLSIRAATVSVKANWASRNIPWSFLSDLIARLVLMRGASGVSLPTASILTGLAPSAAAVFRGSTLVPDRAAETVARRGALIELLGTLTHEAPLALLVDDLHWCDPVSREVLLSALDATEKSRLLVVLAERDHARGVVSRTYRSLPLAPLSLQAVTTFVASVAQFPNEGWEAALCERLTTRLGGSPLHLLETLQLALQRDALRISGGKWELIDSKGLDALLAAGEAMRARLEALPSEARQIVDLLASIGVPLPRQALGLCHDLPADTFESLLGGLEHAGIISSSSEGISLSHDEFAEVARMQLSEKERRIAALRAGGALASVAADRSTMTRAASLMAGGDGPGLGDLFRRFVTLARGEGDTRAPRHLAGELLGGASNKSQHRMLLRSLPLRHRTGLDLPKRRRGLGGAAALILVLLFSAAGLRWWNGAEQGVWLYAQSVDSTGARVLQRYDLPDDWSRDVGPLALSPRGRPVRIPLTGILSVTIPPHNTLPYLVVRDAADSGGLDLYEYFPDGRLHRLTHAPGDDVGPEWAPDGTMIVFSTARWDSLAHTDIAILHRGTGHLQRLTATEAIERGPIWSPDGTRIAYARSQEGGDPKAICIVDADGAQRQCIPNSSSALRIWRDGESLILSSEELGGRLDLLDVSTGAIAPYSSRIGDYHLTGLSQTEVMLCRCLDSLRGVRDWKVLSARDPHSQRSIAFRGVDRLITKVDLQQREASRTWIESISLPQRVEVFEHVPHRIVVSAHRADGLAVPLSAPRWRPSDPSVFSASPAGEIIGLRAGDSTEAVVSAGGWRSGTVRIIVRAATPTRVLSETWQNGIGEQWVSYGEPRPDTVRHRDRTIGVSNRGDGAFDSGVYSRERFTLRDGLAFRARLAGRITMEQWQTQHLAILAGMDRVALARWDHDGGYLRAEGRVLPEECHSDYPAGPEGAGFAKVFNAAGTPTVEFPNTLASGDWFEVTLQVLPDGRCVGMLNNRVIGVSRTISQADSANVVIEGSSVRTDMMVGPLEVWTGVLPEVVKGLEALGSHPQRAKTLVPLR